MSSQEREGDARNGTTKYFDRPKDTHYIGMNVIPNVLLEDGTVKTSWKPSNMFNLFKAYCNDLGKYSESTMDKFEREYMWSLERCDQADLSYKNKQHYSFAAQLLSRTSQPGPAHRK